MSKKFFIILTVMVVIGLGAAYLIRLGFYPIAFVNSSLVSARSFEEAMVSAYNYYNQALKTYSRAEQASEPQLVIQELRRATLEKMIENVLIYKALQAQMGGDLSRIVESKLNPLNLKAPDFEKAVSTLYGLTVERFKALVLIPQAREEILASRMNLEKTDFDDWLKQERQQARIVILAPDLRWDGEKVAVK